MPTKKNSQKPPLNKELLLLAFLCVKDCKNTGEKLKVLDRFDLSDAELEMICGATQGTIRNVRMGLKTGNKKTTPAETQSDAP